MNGGLADAVWRLAYQTYPCTVLEPTFHVSLPNRNIGNRSGIEKLPLIRPAL